MNGYNLIRDWYNYKFSNPSKVKAIHSDFYCYLIDRWNRLGQKKEFGLPTDVTMEALGIGSYNTYKKVLNDLVDFGFVNIVKKSINQHQSKIVAISKFDKALDKSLDEANNKAHDVTRDTIIKQENKETKEQINNTIESIDFDYLLKYINDSFGRSFKVVNTKVKNKYKSLFKQGYTKVQIKEAIDNIKNNQYHKDLNYQYCTLEFFSRAETIDKYSNVTNMVKNDLMNNYYGLPS